MEWENLPRHAWNASGDLWIPAEVEHEGGVVRVVATFRHGEWPNVSVECTARVEPRFLRGYPQRASVVLHGRGRPLYSGPYRLERLLVLSGRVEHEVSPLERLDFYVEEDPSLPDYERNVRRFVQGEEIGLEVEASSRFGVRSVEMTAKRGWGDMPDEVVRFRGKGDGSGRCRVTLKACLRAHQHLGRYRAESMVVSPSDRPPIRKGPTEWDEPLNPPLVFEVLKNKNPPPPPPPKEPESPNWGFSG